MGCVGSKGDVTVDKHPNVFRVINVNHEEWSGQLEVTSTNLTLYRKRKPPTQWPLQCLRRYGYENDTFIFEAGRRCDTGEGIYSFRCARADVLFIALQDYIQESTYNNNNNMTVGSLDDVQQTQERMDSDVAELRRAMGSHGNNPQTTTGSNYIILHGNNGAMAQGTNRSPCNSPANSANNNYLEPLDTSTTTNVNAPPIALQSNPSSNIYTNSMMIPHAQPPTTPGVPGGNVYQQLALAQSSPAGGSMKKSDTLESSPGSSTSPRPMLATTESHLQIRSGATTDAAEIIHSPTTTSPIATTVDDPLAQHNTYMNVTPGEMVLMAAATSNASNGGNWRYSRMNSNASSTATAITERCYENLDAAVISSVLAAQQQQQQPLISNSSSSHAIVSTSSNGRAGGRHSRPDIFSKVDLPMIDSGSGVTALRMSEPCTPTSVGGGGGGLVMMGMSGAQQRKVNYIVLDLDNQSGTSSSVTSGGSGATVTTTTGVTGGSSSSNNSGGTAISSLLTPESPKKRQTLGYATIDFNKTVALSNSTNPTCESEASRKTRF